VPEQFFHFLISPFSKGRYRGICFIFLLSSVEKKEREITFKTPLAYFHPLPYPSPIKGRGEFLSSLLNSAPVNLQFTICN